MDKNAIKRFAVWARRELIARVSQKALQYGIAANTAEPEEATSINGKVLSAEEIRQRRALVYMHRYAPDTIARIRTDYVHQQQDRYRTALEGIEQRMANADTGERVKLSKVQKKLQEQDKELHEYEEKIHHLADQYISIDLDDGVKKNYALFSDVLTKIK